MMFLEFDSSFVSRSDQLTNEPIRSKKTSFTIASNSQKSRTRKRCFCHFTAVFEKPNGHVPRGCITYKLFFLKPITCLSITLCFLCIKGLLNRLRAHCARWSEVLNYQCTAPTTHPVSAFPARADSSDETYVSVAPLPAIPRHVRMNPFIL